MQATERGKRARDRSLLPVVYVLVNAMIATWCFFTVVGNEVDFAESVTITFVVC